VSLVIFLSFTYCVYSYDSRFSAPIQALIEAGLKAEQEKKAQLSIAKAAEAALKYQTSGARLAQRNELVRRKQQARRLQQQQPPQEVKSDTKIQNPPQQQQQQQQQQDDKNENRQQPFPFQLPARRVTTAPASSERVSGGQWVRKKGGGGDKQNLHQHLSDHPFQNRVYISQPAGWEYVRVDLVRQAETRDLNLFDECAELYHAIQQKREREHRQIQTVPELLLRKDNNIERKKRVANNTRPFTVPT
jgi:hypothetical protein